MTTATLDQAGAQAFAGRMLKVLNDGMLCLMVSVGHRTGLFDAMADGAARTSAQLADAARHRGECDPGAAGHVDQGALSDATVEQNRSTSSVVL